MSNGPVITEMTVIPVSGYDSMLLNIAGAHNCHFSRILVMLKDSSGNSGVGECPCSMITLSLLERLVPKVVNTSILKMNTTISQLTNDDARRAHSEQSDLIHMPTVIPERFYNAIAAIEAAMLDLVGKHLNVQVADLLGTGKQRNSIPVLGYLFFIADRNKTTMNYQPGNTGKHDWYYLRHQKAMDTTAVIRLAEAVHDLYGVNDFKLKGGVQQGEYEVETVKALASHFPEARVTVDPNASWSLDEAIRHGKVLKSIVPYLEDPCGAEQGYSGRETLAEFRKATGVPVATNMIANDWRQLGHALKLDAIDIPLADPHFWTMTQANNVARLCNEWGLVTGCHSNNHFDISLAMVAHLGAAAPGDRITPFDTHWIWQDGQYLTKEPLKIQKGNIELFDKPGLGIELDMEKVEQAHALYQSLPKKDRDDSIGMQYLIPGWTFNGKRPCLLR